MLLELICTEHNISKVVHSFGLDVRIVHEAIIDLMYRQMIQVDFENAKIYPNEDVKTVIDQGRLEEFLGIQFPDSKRILWAQDTRIGEIFMYDDVQNYLSKPPILYHEKNDTLEFKDTKVVSKSAKYRIHLNQKNFIPLPECSRQRLLKTAKMQLRQYISEGSIYDRVRTIKKIAPIDNATIYIPVNNEKVQGNDHLIAQSELIPSDVLESWIASITDLSPYIISDLTSLSEDFLFRYDWIRLTEMLDVLLSRLGEIFSNKGNIKIKVQNSIHYIETTIYNKILPYIKELIMYSDKFDFGRLRGQNLFNKLKSDLEKAEHLVIIGSPFIQEEIFEDIKPILQNLLSKSAKIIIIWGGLGDKPLNIMKSSFIAQDNIWFVESNSKFHSKFLIIDNSVGWITSCNIINYGYTQNNPMEDYCVFRNKALILELYEYSRLRIENESLCKTIDSYLQSVPIILRNDKVISELEETLNNTLKILELMTNKEPKKINIESLKEQSIKLKSIFSILRSIQTGIIIQNLDHRKFLRVVLQDARRKVELGTDRVIENALSPVILSAFNESLDNSVSIEVKWGREENLLKKTPEMIRLKSSVELLNNQTSNRLKISMKPSHSHAKYLIMDNHLLLITSYNLLAFSGNGLSDEEITDELGIVISGKKITFI